MKDAASWSDAFCKETEGNVIVEKQYVASLGLLATTGPHMFTMWHARASGTTARCGEARVVLLLGIVIVGDRFSI